VGLGIGGDPLRTDAARVSCGGCLDCGDCGGLHEFVAPLQKHVNGGRGADNGVEVSFPRTVQPPPAGTNDLDVNIYERFNGHPAHGSSSVRL
jgi:hypothetical protein